MKTRYLLTALTLPLLAACTQDEFDVQVNNGNAALQGRVEVGKVAFTTGANTRFDFGDAEHIGWEDGERFGLFLMDDWNEAGNAAGNGEQLDANETDFKDQQVWNNMYSLHNYTQTNIPFTFNRTEGIWENDDAVVEGNNLLWQRPMAKKIRWKSANWALSLALIKNSEPKRTD